MKLHILSDLHIDTYQRKSMPLGNIPQTDADIVILAGDISNSSLGMHWAIKQSKHLRKPILFVAGNHEYFDEDIATFDDELRRMSDNSAVHYLQKNRYDAGGLRFLGCTLWTGFSFGAQADLFGEAQAQKNIMQLAKEQMRDYKGIYCGQGFFTPEIALELHKNQCAWLKKELIQAQQENIPTVAIVHHGVSPRSVAPKYQNHPNNAAFITDFSEWMHADWAPKLWIHGHTHDAFDYTEGHTRVIVNPRAYPKEISSTNVAFDWEKVVTINPH